MKVVIPLSLDDQRDADLITWLAGQTNKSSAVRDVLRANLAGGVTLADIYLEIKALKNYSFTAVTEPAPIEDEVGANLDKLLSL